MEVKKYENKDDAEAALNGLAMFTHSFCMDVDATNQKDDLVFRCKQCEFHEKDRCCTLKRFLFAHYKPEDASKATCMSF